MISRLEQSRVADEQTNAVWPFRFGRLPCGSQIRPNMHTTWLTLLDQMTFIRATETRRFRHSPIRLLTLRTPSLHSHLPPVWALSQVWCLACALQGATSSPRNRFTAPQRRFLMARPLEWALRPLG